LPDGQFDYLGLPHAVTCIGVRALTVVDVSQLSFFSAESLPPAVSDLTGVLAAPGQIVTVGGGARLSVVVDQFWRAQALGQMIDEAGLTAEITQTEENTPLVRTAVDARLRPMAGEWTRGAVKTVHRCGCLGRGSCGPGHWPQAAPTPTVIFWDWTRTRRTPIRPLHRR